MSFWNSEKMKERLPTLIDKFREDRIKHSAYELSLGLEYFLTSESSSPKIIIRTGDQIAIPPGQFGLLITEESVKIPADALGLISIRFRYKEPGLINVSGFHVDPGFEGRLKFSVYNAGPNAVHLTAGAPVFMLWFASLSDPTTDLYDGKRMKQLSLSDQDTMVMSGQLASPASLKTDIEKLRTELTNLKWIGGVVAAALIGLVLRGGCASDSKNSTTPVNEPAAKQPLDVGRPTSDRNGPGMARHPSDPHTTPPTSRPTDSAPN